MEASSSGSGGRRACLPDAARTQDRDRSSNVEAPPEVPLGETEPRARRLRLPGHQAGERGLRRLQLCSHSMCAHRTVPSTRRSDVRALLPCSARPCPRTLADQQLILEVGMQIRRIAPVALLLAATACGEAALDPGSAGVSPVRSRIAPGATTALVAPSPVSISAPLRIDKTIVSSGGTVTGTVTYQNTSTSSITIRSVAIAARPPGGTHGGGPYSDLRPYLGSSVVLPGGTVTLTASRTFTATDPLGQWETYPTYQDSAGVYHDGPSLFFTVAAPGISISTPLQIDNTTVSAGGTLNGTVTYQNTSATSITIRSVAIAARPPGGTHGGGPYDDFQPYPGSPGVLPRANVTLTAS